MAPEPVRHRDLARAVGKQSGALVRLPVPGFLARAIAGEMAQELHEAQFMLVPRSAGQRSWVRVCVTLGLQTLPRQAAPKKPEPWALQLRLLAFSSGHPLEPFLPTTTRAAKKRTLKQGCGSKA